MYKLEEESASQDQYVVMRPHDGLYWQGVVTGTTITKGQGLTESYSVWTHDLRKATALNRDAAMFVLQHESGFHSPVIMMVPVFGEIGHYTIDINLRPMYE